MKGSPFKEVVLILIGFFILFVPVGLLTQPTKRIHDHAHAPEQPRATSEVEAWLRLTYSHEPETVQLFHDGNLLWEGGGSLSDDPDIAFRLSEARSELTFNFRWSETVEQAYVDIELEPDGLAARTWGFWSSGEDTRVWHLSWEGTL